VANRQSAVGVALRRGPGRRSDQGTLARAGTVYSAPTPAPLAPPTNPGPAVAPPSGLSPLLAQPGPLFPTSRLRGPSYPASPNPAPVDQQKMQGYGNDLLGQRWQLERQGVSPDNRRFRELQQQLNQPGSR